MHVDVAFVIFFCSEVVAWKGCRDRIERKRTCRW